MFCDLVNGSVISEEIFANNSMMAFASNIKPRDARSCPAKYCSLRKKSEMKKTPVKGLEFPRKKSSDVPFLFNQRCLSFPLSFVFHGLLKGFYVGQPMKGIIEEHDRITVKKLAKIARKNIDEKKRDVFYLKTVLKNLFDSPPLIKICFMIDLYPSSF
jgi:hypothetical protein